MMKTNLALSILQVIGSVTILFCFIHFFIKYVKDMFQK